MLTANENNLNAMTLLFELLLLLLSLQSCLTLSDPIDGSPPGSPLPGILQARTLQWVAISFSKAWTWKVKVKSLNCVRLFETPWTAAYQAPLFMGFSRQEYWSGVPLPSPFILAAVIKGKGHRIVALDIIHVHKQICTHGNNPVHPGIFGWKRHPIREVGKRLYLPRF